MICKRRNYNKTSFKLRFLLGIMVITVIAGFSTIAFTASAQNSNNRESDRISYFDPFELSTIYLGALDNELNTPALGNPVTISPVNDSAILQDTNVSNALITRPPIRVPYRPPLRSPFRPPLDPGPPSWYPGDPPWDTGP